MAAWLSAEAEDEMRRHAQDAYPQEACGFLAGRFESKDVRVVRARRAPNAAGGDRGASFALQPRDLLAAQDALEGTGVEIVGFYHSHPDVPAAPSDADHAHAWPGYVHAIVSVLRSEA